MSVQFSCSVMSDSLWSHGLQHTRLPCPSPAPRAYSNSSLLSRNCHPTTSYSVIPFSFSLSQWKVAAEPGKMPGFLAPRGEEFNLGPETKLDCSELLCDKVLFKYKRDRKSFWQRHQKGAERIPHCWSLAGCYIATSSLLIKERKCLKTQRMTLCSSPTRCILR